MGCNCGKKNLNRISKYTDDGQDFNEDGGIIVKAVQGMVQIMFGILMAIIFIVMAVPMIAYVIFCLVFNLTPSVRLRDFRKLFNKG
jgi:hypothetical protein